MAVSWSSVLINRIAPGLAEFSRADVPDLAADFPQAPHWVANCFLNSTLRGQFGDGMRQAVFG